MLGGPLLISIFLLQENNLQDLKFSSNILQCVNFINQVKQKFVIWFS